MERRGTGCKKLPEEVTMLAEKAKWVDLQIRGCPLVSL